MSEHLGPGQRPDPRARGRPHVLRRHPRAEGDLADGERGRGRDADRRQRRGQVDDPPLDQRAQPPARSGTIHFRGRDITNAPPHGIVKDGIAQSPEGRRLFPRMSVLENLEMGAFQRTDKANFQEDLDRVFHLFPRLAERKQQKAGTMSGGEQQMVAMGRALMARPKLLLLDEPSMGLAPIFVEKIFEIVARDQCAGHPDPARRAERADGARRGQPRLRDGDGRRSRSRGRRRSCARTSGSARRTWARIELASLSPTSSGK